MATTRRVRSSAAAAAVLGVLVGGACADDGGVDIDEEVETPGPGLDEGEDLPAVEGEGGESDNFDPDVDVDSGIQPEN